MTVVFVHGVPETAAVWDDLREELDRDSAAVALPGFGSRRAGSPATKEAMVDAVLAELDRWPDPVDLVGHDWGTPIVLRIATAHPDRIRSWVVDIAAVAHPLYLWHDLARVWQSDDGERWMRSVLAESRNSVPAFFTQLSALGIPISEVANMAAQFDDSMAMTILELYRSAAPNIDVDWPITRSGTASRPGLVLRATEDPFDDHALALEVASALGAEVAELPGCSHFWMKQDPATAAAVLQGWLPESV